MVRRVRKALPAGGALLRRRRDENVRRGAVPASQGGLRRAAASDGLSPAWPIAYDEFEPYYTLAEQHYQVHGARGEDPTEPPSSAPYRSRRSHEPRIQQLTDDLAAAGYRRSTLPAGSCSTSRTHHSRPASTAHLRRLPVSRPCEVGRGGARRAPSTRASECHAADEHQGREARHERSGPAVTEVVVEREGGRSDSRRMSSWSPAERPTRPNCSCGRHEKHPNGLANGSDQVGRNYMFHDSTASSGFTRGEPDRVPEGSPSTTSTSAGTTSGIRSATCRWSASQGANVPRRTAGAIPGSRPSGHSSEWRATR